MTIPTVSIGKWSKYCNHLNFPPITGITSIWPHIESEYTALQSQIFTMQTSTVPLPAQVAAELKNITEVLGKSAQALEHVCIDCLRALPYCTEVPTVIKNTIPQFVLPDSELLSGYAYRAQGGTVHELFLEDLDTGIDIQEINEQIICSVLDPDIFLVTLESEDQTWFVVNRI